MNTKWYVETCKDCGQALERRCQSDRPTGEAKSYCGNCQVFVDFPGYTEAWY